MLAELTLRQHRQRQCNEYDSAIDGSMGEADTAAYVFLGNETSLTWQSRLLWAPGFRFA